MKPEPQTQQELLDRAYAIAGMTFKESWMKLKSSDFMPNDLKRDKGWVGATIRMAFVKVAARQPEQDFRVRGLN